MAEFKDRLREERIKKHTQQKELADFLEIQVRAYQNYEYGKNFPTFKGLVCLADYFDVSLDYLVGRSDIRERR